MRANQYICDLTPYQPGLPIELVARKYGIDAKDIVKLASNENPLGPSPLALKAVDKAKSNINRYPEQFALTQALSAALGVEPSALIIGNGSNDILDLVARTHLKEGDEAITSQYAFAVYHIATQSVGATDVVVPAHNYGHDLDAMRAAITSATKVVWIANPNNPTGTLAPYAKVRQFLEKIPRSVLVVLDEASYEYLPDNERVNTVAWLREYPNLILVRTFSKIYGLAGLRVGYGIASPTVAELLNRVRLPFTSNSLAMAAATAALDDHDFVSKSYELNQAGRKWLTDELERLGLTCLPAYGNFVTFRVREAARVNEALLEQGVIVRPLSGYGMADWLRVSVGLREENERFMRALAGIM